MKRLQRLTLWTGMFFLAILFASSIVNLMLGDWVTFLIGMSAIGFFAVCVLFTKSKLFEKMARVSAERSLAKSLQSIMQSIGKEDFVYPETTKEFQVYAKEHTDEVRQILEGTPFQGRVFEQLVVQYWVETAKSPFVDDFTREKMTLFMMRDHYEIKRILKQTRQSLN